VKVRKFVRGTPYSRSKNRGDTAGVKRWSDAVISQTKRLRKVRRACRLNVEFVLPKTRPPTDYPYANDLDNLLKLLLDALGQTVLRYAPGRDSAIVELHASKRLAGKGEKTGALITFEEDPTLWS
jgi:Holliday junction resolvase RusA-like endonuclease